MKNLPVPSPHSPTEPCPAPSDEALMLAYIAGDSAAFEQLFRRYKPLLTRVLGRGCFRDDVPDLVQQTFLHVHRARQSFARYARVRPWIVAIARNLQREGFRQRKRRARLDAELPELSWRPASPEVAVDARRTLVALRTLPEPEREAIELMCCSGLSANQARARLGATVACLKSRVHRGRERLRAQAGA